MSALMDECSIHSGRRFSFGLAVCIDCGKVGTFVWCCVALRCVLFDASCLFLGTRIGGGREGWMDDVVMNEMFYAPRLWMDEDMQAEIGNLF